MPAPADEPLRRVNMQFYSRDWDWLYRRHGHNVSAAVRAIIRAHIRDTDAVQEIDMKIIGGPSDE